MFRWLPVVAALGACSSTLDPDPPHALAWDARAISVAEDHTLLVTPTGTVESTGTEIPQPTDSEGKALALGLPVATRVAVGHAHACIISTTGSVHCWGDHTHGALGAHRTCIPPQTEGGVANCKLGAEIMPALPPMRDLAAGEDVTCAITMEDRVVCWGEQGDKLGGSIVPALDPPQPVKLADGTSLSAARVIIDRGTVCAIDRAQTAWCWGDGFGGRPQRFLDGVIDLAINRHHSCAITGDGLTCWGQNRNGESGDVIAARECGDDCSIGLTSIPVDAVRVVVGERHSCALTATAQIVCWGSNEVGQIGHADAFLVGDLGVALEDATDLVAGYAHTCALRRDGSAWCWGAHLTEQAY